MTTTHKIHPATLVSNIKTCVPIQLEEDGSNFHTWVTLFELHCSAHLVESHIAPEDSSNTSDSKDPDWKRLDGFIALLVPLFLRLLFVPKKVLIMLGLALGIIFKIIRLLVFFVSNLNSMRLLLIIFQM